MRLATRASLFDQTVHEAPGLSVEIFCSLVLGINPKRKNCNLRSRRTHSSVGEQGGTELVAVKGLIDGQASDSRNRNGQRDALSRGQKSTA